MQPTLPGLPLPPVSSFADQVRAEFWQLQVPMLVLDAPGGGVDGLSDFGERVHFPDQTAVEFFLAGYRLGERVGQQAPLDMTPPEEATTEEPPSD